MANVITTRSVVFDSDAKDLPNFVARAKRAGAVQYVLRCAPQRRGKGGAPAYRTIQSWDPGDKKHEPVANWVKNTAEADAEHCSVSTVYTVVALDSDTNVVAQLSDRADPVEADVPETSPVDAMVAKLMEALAASQAQTNAAHAHLIEMTQLISGHSSALLGALTTISHENRELWKEGAVNDSKAAIALAEAARPHGVDAQGWLEFIKTCVDDFKTYKMLQLQQRQETTMPQVEDAKGSS